MHDTSARLVERVLPGPPLHPAARALVKASVPLEEVAREVG